MSNRMKRISKKGHHISHITFENSSRNIFLHYKIKVINLYLLHIFHPLYRSIFILSFHNVLQIFIITQLHLEQSLSYLERNNFFSYFYSLFYIELIRYIFSIISVQSNNFIFNFHSRSFRHIFSFSQPPPKRKRWERVCRNQTNEMEQKKKKRKD